MSHYAMGYLEYRLAAAVLCTIAVLVVRAVWRAITRRRRR